MKSNQMNYHENDYVASNTYLKIELINLINMYIKLRNEQIDMLDEYDMRLQKKIANLIKSRL
jgi:hypothetical protein